MAMVRQQTKNGAYVPIQHCFHSVDLINNEKKNISVDDYEREMCYIDVIGRTCAIHQKIYLP